MESSLNDDWTEEQRTWALHSEALWTQAHQITERHAGVDIGYVYHALRCLELTPTERLRRGLRRGEFTLTSAERALFAALNQRGVRFIIIGMGGAATYGAPVPTQNLEVWFAQAEDDAIRAAAKDAGGFWISGFGMQPPAFGGEDLARIDVVLTAHGLDAFATEYAKAIEREIEGVTVRVLPLERVIASKRATQRAKDVAQLPVREATLVARDESHRE
jgi:hypothetical protein